jgi:hypothetical protein
VNPIELAHRIERLCPAKSRDRNEQVVGRMWPASYKAPIDTAESGRIGGFLRGILLKIGIHMAVGRFSLK